jgi:hypothetical protein
MIDVYMFFWEGYRPVHKNDIHEIETTQLSNEPKFVLEQH